MKIVTYILIGVLVIALGAGAAFFFLVHMPMKADYTKIKLGMPEMDKAKMELKRYKDKESKESGWVPQAAGALQAGLKDEIAAGKAEVAVSGSRVVVNISEQALYLPGSKTFAKDITTLGKLAPLLKANGMEDKEIGVGNTTPSIPAQGKGRKKSPAKDGRVLAGERSLELVKYLEKNGVGTSALVSSAYAPTPADKGFKIKDKKTVIVVSAQLAVSQETAAPAAQAKPATPAKPAAAPAPAGSKTATQKPAAAAPAPQKPAAAPPKAN